MFGFKKKNKDLKIFATQDGTVVNLDNVPDEVFSQKMLGDGIAIMPKCNEVYSPVNGTIVQVTDTLHAYAIQSDDGLDVLVHIGINTVELKGEGFKAMVKEGDHVKTGDIIAVADLDFIKSKGYELYTPTVITNMDAVKDLSSNEGEAKAGKTAVITYSL